jgi:hypothetical protein
MEQQHPSEPHPNSTVLLAKLIVKLTVLSAVLRLRLWWLSFSRGWLGPSRKPPVLNPFPNQFAVAHQKAKQLDRGLSNLLDVGAGLNFPLGDLEPELSFDVHELEEEELIFTELTYYKIKNLKEHLAIVRYSVIDEDGTIEVTEETYEDSLEDAERLQQEIVDSIEAGIDCSIMTDQESEVFPTIHLLLTEGRQV